MTTPQELINEIDVELFRNELYVSRRVRYFISEAVSVLKSLELLRSQEGWGVTICCDNPEGSPNAAVDCCGEWTDWKDERFTGETVYEAITKAGAACNDSNFQRGKHQ